MSIHRLIGGLAVACTLALLLAGAPAAAGEGGEATAYPVATDEAAKTALTVFQREYKARGLKGDDKLSQRDFAMRRLSRFQHPVVAARLAKLCRSRDEMLRTLAVIYLGDQRAVPGPAGAGIVTAMKRYKKDRVFVISALQSIGHLRYLGAGDEMYALLAHDDYSIKKAAILAIGETRDLRMLDRLLKVVGIHYKAGSGGEDDGDGVVVEEGYSWEGVDVFIPYSGSGDEEAERERVGQAMIESNKKAAEKEAAAGNSVRGSSPGAGNNGAGSGPRGAGSRDRTGLIPPAVIALRRMTGQPFESTADIVRWLQANGKTIRERSRELDRLERRQRKGESVR